MKKYEALNELPFNVGDTVKIIANIHGHGFNRGEEVTISSHDPEANDGTGDYRVTNKTYGWYVTSEEIELVKSKLVKSKFKPTRFIMTQRTGQQDIKQGNRHKVKSITKDVVTDQDGRVLLYLPDYLEDSEKSAILTILNRNNKIIV